MVSRVHYGEYENANKSYSNALENGMKWKRHRCSRARLTIDRHVVYGVAPGTTTEKKNVYTQIHPINPDLYIWKKGKPSLLSNVIIVWCACARAFTGVYVFMLAWFVPSAHGYMGVWLSYFNAIQRRDKKCPINVQWWRKTTTKKTTTENKNHKKHSLTIVW